jgi:hypothetical protein
MLRSRGLNKKHLKALELLRTTDMPVFQVAKEVGMNKDHLFDLLCGSEKAGPVAQEFSAMYSKVIEDLDKRIQLNTKQLKDIVTTGLMDWAKQQKTLTEGARTTYVQVTKALQATPTYNIGSVSYSRGLNPEEMVNEFKRLRAIADSALGRTAVQGVGGEGSGVLSSLDGRGNQTEEVETDTSVRTESQAGALS